MKSPKFIRHCYVLIVLIASVLSAKAQTISGKINDPEGKPAIFASVALYTAKDSSLSKAAATDEQGIFEFPNTSSGKYFITASFVGFNNINSKVFDFDGKNYSAEPLTLKKAESNLKEVTVTSTKPLIEVKADKLIVNVEGSINSTGFNALELLQKSPGVQVDKDDNVLVKGKSGVKIYIDGRPSPLAGRDLAAILKGMNSSDIEAIEIITNPSAKYDAGGNLGIINIRLKKNKKLGTNGNISINPTFAITPKINLAGGINYRDKKWNFFGTYSFEQGIWHNTTEDDKIINNTIFNKLWHGEWRDTSQNFKTGIDYFLNDKNTIGFVINGGRSRNGSYGQSSTLIGNQNFLTTDSARLESLAIAPGKSTNFNYNLNYRFLDTAGHELTIDADLGQFSSNRSTFQPNYYTFSNPKQVAYNRVYQQQTPTDITIRSIKADYEQPFFKGKLGYGLKGSSVESQNTFDLFNVQNEMAVRDTDRSNSFTYTEKVFAGYINFNKQLNKKWSLQAGLRAEQTISLGNLVSFKQNALDKVDTSYLNLFPSFALTFNASKNNTLNFNYSRRIDRPSYQDLNPFEFKIDELYYGKGNPFLRPRYTNTFKLTHTFKSLLTSSLEYYYTADDYNDITRVDGNRVYGTLENFAHSQGISLNITLNTPITKWWELNYNITVQKSAIHADFKNELAYDVNNTNYYFNGSSTFKLNKTTTFEISGWYNSRFNWIYVNKAQGIMDIGLKKKILNDKADIKLSMSDVLNTVGWSALYVHNGITQNLFGAWEARRYSINFNYRFGSSEIKGARNHKSSSEEEANRIKK